MLYSNIVMQGQAGSTHLHCQMSGLPICQGQGFLLRLEVPGDCQGVVRDDIELVEPQHVCGCELIVHN